MEDKTNKNKETENKLDKMKHDVLDKEKCKTIAQKLTEYIKKEVR